MFKPLLFTFFLLQPLLAQDAKPEDRNDVNTSAKPGDMMLDSPVKFPAKGALPSKFPPDITPLTFPTEEGYLITSSPCRTLSQIDQIQATMPPGKFQIPTHDWKHLTRTRQILTEGGELRILALGDSIVNDTMRSGWITKLSETYPQALIETTVYVRGGGNCGHFKQENRIQKNVLPRQPHLVLIGGISQEGIHDTREVIKQLRAGLPEVEILLFTGTFGTTDPRNPDALAQASHSGSGPYGKQLQSLAIETSCAYLDMTTPWSQYIRSTGLHPHFFYRDAVHANSAGEQILSKILMTFLSPTT